MFVKMRVPHLLISYLYAGHLSKSLRHRDVAVLQASGERFVDSGAFTIRQAVLGERGTQSTSGRITDPDEYLARYVAWIQRMSQLRLVDWWVEMDIGVAVGNAWVEAQRAAWTKAGVGHGLINVWHQEHDWDYWMYLLREAKRPGRSGYVAIEGHRPNRPPLEYGRFLEAAYRRGVRVHGFAMTTESDLLRWPFYSVDSTSWQAGIRFAAAPSITRTGGVRAKLMNKQTIALGQLGDQASWRAPIRPGQNTHYRLEQMEASMRTWVQCAVNMTNIWRARGIDWERAIATPEIIDDQSNQTGAPYVQAIP